LKTDNDLVEVSKLYESNKILEGELIHSSDSRICYINNTRNNLIQSGDYALFRNNRLYLKGRIDRVIKINAKIVNLNSLEAVINESILLISFKL
jgi:hypothetical protein